MSDDEARITISGNATDVVARVKQLVAERGLELRTVAPTAASSTLDSILSGPRKLLASDRSLAGVGSWLAVRVETDGARTQLSFLAKPNLGGTEVCSDADARLADAEVRCQDTRIDPRSPYAAAMTGREEVELVGGLVAELRTASDPAL